MKLKKVIAMALAATMTLSVAGCGGNGGSSETGDTEAATAAKVEETKTEAEIDTEADTAEVVGEAPTYSSIVLGESYTDLTTTIKWIHHKTDRQEDGTIENYIAEFNKVYPNITVETEAITDYAEDSLLRLSSGDWGDIMFIPAIDKAELSEFFIPYGTTEEMDEYINFPKQWEKDGPLLRYRLYGKCTGRSL